MFTAIGRVIRFAFQNFWRNFWLSIITITMLVLTLLAVNVLLGLRVLGVAAVHVVESHIDVTVAFVPKAAASSVAEVRTYLTGLPQVASTDLMNPEQALAAFREQHQNDPQILASLDEVGGNPFGATLVVRAKKATDYPAILTALENPTYEKIIDSKNFADHRTLIDRINQLVERARRFGMILAAVFAVLAVFIIMNTIRVALYTFREEIGIMKLVGASNGFVRAPFLFEGVWNSLLAVIITTAILVPTLFFVEPRLVSFFEGTPVGLIAYFRDNGLVIALAEFVALSVLSMLTSAIALGRYLKN